MVEPVHIVRADLGRREHRDAVRNLTAAYAEDPMGNDGPLSSEVLDRLVPGLASHPTTVVLLAFVGEQAVGLATCFLGFSTFLARPVLNIHDLAVLPGHRGRGLGRALLAAVDETARSLGCGRVTLEVQEGNTRARRIYADAGFRQAAYGGATGGALFYTKPIPAEGERT